MPEFVAGDFNHDGKLDLAVAVMGPQIGVFQLRWCRARGWNFQCTGIHGARSSPVQSSPPISTVMESSICW